MDNIVVFYLSLLPSENQLENVQSISFLFASSRYGSADPDLDSHQNVMDPCRTLDNAVEEFGKNILRENLNNIQKSLLLLAVNHRILNYL